MPIYGTARRLGHECAAPPPPPPDGALDAMNAEAVPEGVDTRAVSKRRPIARQSMFRNLMAMGSSQVVSWLLGLVAQIVQPRFLGPDGLGQIQLAFALWMVTQVFATLGTSIYLTLEMARDQERGAALVGPIIMVRLATFAVATACMAGYAQLVGFDREMKVLLIATGVTMLLNTIQDVFGAALIGLEQMGFYSIATIVGKFFYTALMVIVLTSGGGVVGLAWTTAVNAALALSIIAYFYRRLANVSFARPPVSYPAIVRRSAGFMVAGIIVTLYMQVDMVVMSLLVDEDALGWYTSADVLRSSLGFVPALLMTVLFPRIGRLHVTDSAAIAGIVRRTYRVLALAGLAMGLGLAVIAEPFAVLLFGEDFRQAGDVLAVFGLSLPVMFLTLLLGQVALATEREWFWNRLMFIGILMAVIFDVAFVPVFDRHTGNAAVVGALSYVVTEGFMVVVGTRRIAPELVRADFLVTLARGVVAASLMFLASWPLRDQMLLIPISVGASVFLAAAIVLRLFTDEDRELIRRLVDRFGVRLRSARRAG